MLGQVDVKEFDRQRREWKDPAIHIFESEDVECMLNDAAEDQQWQDVEFEVALDSGSIVNVCHPDDAPGYVLQESLGSRRNQNFIVGDGGKLKNLGQMILNLEANTTAGSANSVSSTFQIAKVTRPLMSVGHICDQGLSVNFGKNNSDSGRSAWHRDMCIS